MLFYSLTIYSLLTQITKTKQKSKVFLLCYSNERLNIPQMQFNIQETRKAPLRLSLILFLRLRSNSLFFPSEHELRILNLRRNAMPSLKFKRMLVWQSRKNSHFKYCVVHKFDTKVSTHCTSAVSTLRHTYRVSR